MEQLKTISFYPSLGWPEILYPPSKQAIQPRNSLQFYKTKDKIAIAAKTVHKDKKKKNIKEAELRENIQNPLGALRKAAWGADRMVTTVWLRDLTADWLWAFELAVPPN